MCTAETPSKDYQKLWKEYMAFALYTFHLCDSSPWESHGNKILADTLHQLHLTGHVRMLSVEGNFVVAEPIRKPPK